MVKAGEHAPSRAARPKIHLADLTRIDVLFSLSGGLTVPEEQGRRRFPRFAVHLPFLYTAEAAPSATKGAGWTRSLSEGGATVELSKRLRPLTPLHLRLQTERAAVEAEAQVVWSGGRAPEGGGVVHGVGFSHIAPDTFQAIRDMFRPPAGMRHAGVRLPLDLLITCHPKNPAGPPLQGRTGNANRGGLFLRLPRLVPPGTAHCPIPHT